MDYTTARAALLAERDSLLDQLAATDLSLEQVREARATREDRADAGSGSNDGDPMSVEIENLTKLRAGTEASLAALDAAVARVDDGTYGICVGCGEEIPTARLEALPSADECVQCKQAGSSLRRR